MPNLVGIIEPGAASLKPDLERMMDVVDIPSFPYVRREAFAPGVAVGNVLTHIEDNLSQPVSGPDAWLMLDGEIMGAAELRRDLEAEGVDATQVDDAGLAMAAYTVWGESFLERLNGQWNIVIHHGDTTIIASDRIGSRILYYAHDAGRFVFGSEMKAVVAGRKVASRAGGYGLLELLMGPYHHGDRTWVDGVQVLDPGTILRLRHGRVDARRYWRFSFNEGGPEMSEDDYAEGFAAHLRGAVRRCTRRDPAHKLAITLSGGLDSRAIALSIDPRQRPIPALTYGDEDSADVRFARQLAGVIGLDFHYVEAEKERLFEASRGVLDDTLGVFEGQRGFYGSQIDRIVYRDEVMGDPMGAASMIWHPLYSQHMNLMLQGACGDALTGSHVTWGHMLARGREEIISDLMRAQYYAPREILELVLNRRFLDAHWDQREARFRQLFDAIDADQPAAIASVWDMENRQRRGAFSTFTMERYFCVVRAPFLDYELVDHLRSIPASWRFQQRVYKRMIVQCYPEAAHVPWAYTRRPLTTSPGREFAWEVGSFLARKARGLLSPQRRDAQYAFRDTGALLREDREISGAVERWLI